MTGPPDEEEERKLSDELDQLLVRLADLEAHEAEEAHHEGR
jgi:hypothetical protein